MRKDKEVTGDVSIVVKSSSINNSSLKVTHSIKSNKPSHLSTGISNDNTNDVISNGKFKAASGEHISQTMDRYNS